MASYNNYNYLRDIDGGKKPQDTHLIIETSLGYLYFVDSSDNTLILKTTDEGLNVSTAYNADNVIVSMSYDRTSELIWFVKWVSATRLIVYTLDLSDDSVTSRFNEASVIEELDGVADAGTYDCATVVEIGASSNICNLRSIIGVGNSGNVTTVDLGDSAGRTYEISMVVEVSGYLWFLFQWSDETVRICRVKMGVALGNDYGFLDAVDNPDLPVQSQQGLTYDGVSTLSFVLDYSGTRYYCTYNVSTGTFTKKGKYDIALMVDRHSDSSNAEPFNREKGFHISQDKVYQIARTVGYLDLISVQDFFDKIIAITDTYLICDGAEIYKYEDFMNYVYTAEWEHSKQDYPRGKDFAVNRNYVEVDLDMLVQIIGRYSVSGIVAGTGVVFEGYVDNYNESAYTELKLRSPAESDLKQKPNGKYSGRTDEIITDLIGDYCGYITAGTLSTGQGMGEVDFKGDKYLDTIFNNFASIDFFTWKLNAIGKFDYDNGSVDIGVTYNEDTDPPIIDVDAWHPNRRINFIEVFGSLTDGVEAYGYWEDLESQQTHNVNILIHRDANLKTDALCTTTAEQLGSREGVNVLQAECNVQDKIRGVCLPGQRLDISYASTDVNIPSGQFLIDTVYADAKNDIYEYKATNGLIFTKKQKEGDLPQENSQLIQQNTDTINSIAGGLAIYLQKDASADIGGYLHMCTEYPDDVKTEVMNATVTADDQLLEEWATEIDCPGITELLTGIYSLHCHAYKFSGNKDVRLYYKLYKRTHPGGVETLLGTSVEGNILEDSEAQDDVHMYIESVALDKTDRLVLKIYASLEGVGSNPVVYFYVEGDTLVRIQVPVSGIQAADLIKKIRVPLALIENVATRVSGYVLTNAVAEQCRVNWKVPADCDVTQTIKVTFTFYCTSADAAVACLLYIGFHPTDMSEARSNNIENATAINLDSTTANRDSKYEYSFAANVLSVGESGYVAINLNEAARSVYWSTGEVEYTRKVG